MTESAASEVRSRLFMSIGATAHQALAEAFQAPARDNPAGRLASEQDSQAGLGQAVQAAGADNPALRE